MILHICEDNRFVAMAKNQFDSIDSHQHVYLVNSNSKQLKYISSSQNVTVLIGGTEEHKKFIRNHDWSAIIFHNCNHKYKWNIINNLPSDIKTIWFSWGSDIYTLPKLRNNLYLDETTTLLRKLNNGFINLNKDYILRLLLGKYKTQLKAYHQLDYCAPVIDEDLELINNAYSLNIKLAQFNYGDLNHYLGNDIDRKVNGNNILIGNSGDFSNNHLDAFKLLQLLNTQKSKIIVPLSYGGNKKYISSILNKGEELFSENFQPLNTLMPLNNYRELLFSCSFAIMNHLRQQAVGNIIMLLWMGVKIFFDSNNPVYKYFSSNNILVFQTSDLIKPQKQIMKPLSTAEVNHNREILSSLYSKEKVAENTLSILKLIDE
jgi:hypothetical protein